MPTIHQTNPFSTRFVRPAVNEHLFAEGTEVATLLAAFAANNRWGQVIGPHGSGKTTLLHALAAELAADATVEWMELHDGQRQLPCTTADMAAWNATTVVIVDGYEQLSWWSRWRLQAACRRSESGLLVTSHASVGLPLLYQSQPTEAVAQALAERLMAGHRPLIKPAEVSEQFAACKGDIRETLFRLYDLYEQRML